MIVIIVAIVFAFAVLEMISGIIDSETIRVVVALISTGLCILGYKIPGCGYGLKFLTSVITSYKMILPILTSIADSFVNDEKLLIVQIIGTLVGAGLLTKWQIDVTEFTFLDTDSVSIDEIGSYFEFSRLKNLKYRFPKRNNNVIGRRKKQKKDEKQQIKIQLQQLKEEQERIEKLKAQFEREKRELNLQKEQEQISFFDGCKNDEEIKVRYHKLAQAYHPDEKGGNEELFKRLKAEYESLMKTR